MVVIVTVIAVILVPTVWDAVKVDALACLEVNTSISTATGRDCYGTVQTGAVNPFCVRCVNGTTETLLNLAPLIFVGVVLFGAVLLGSRFV